MKKTRLVRGASSRSGLTSLLAAALAACSPSHPAAVPCDGRDDAFTYGGKSDTGGVVEGSPEARGVLRVANELERTELTEAVGLAEQAADNIVYYRLGDDQVAGTADDEVFDTLAELDAVPYVGPIAFGSLLAYARDHGYVVSGGDGCADATVLAGPSGSVTGATAGDQDDAQGSCGGLGPDRVYRVQVDAEVRATFDVGGYDTVLHLRAACDDAATEIACNDDGGPNLGSRLALTLAPGEYSLWVDSYGGGGAYTLTYAFVPNPCADEEAQCPGEPVCQASADWSTYQCVCPAGTIPHEGTCIDDPCDPNPCTEEHKTTCVVELPAAFHCQCNVGYIPDPAAPETCVMDPNANEWTVAVYLNADNNLESYGYVDLGEMTAVGSNPYVNVAVLLDSSSRDGGTGRHLYVRQGGYDTLDDLGEVDMGNWETLASFGQWVVEHYPARHYALVMWNHGSGWDAKVPPLLKAFSNDDHGTYDGISIAKGDYAKALEAVTRATGRKLDLVGFDACLMGMWEVAAATAPYARYLVASSETEPAQGWDYTYALGQLVANHTMPADEFGRHIVDGYAQSSTSAATLAVTNLDTIPDLAQAVSAFADALRADPAVYPTLETLRAASQAFPYSGSSDLQDFAERVAAQEDLPQAVRDAAAALVTQLQSSIVYSRAQETYPGSHGLAVYFPGLNMTEDSAYDQGEGAVWASLATWDEFLRSF